MKEVTTNNEEKVVVKEFTESVNLNRVTEVDDGYDDIAFLWEARMRKHCHMG